METIFKCIVGSQAYGTAVEGSDIDYKSVHLLPLSDILTFNYRDQFSVNKDDTSYEVKRFLELVQTANPTMLELLFAPEDTIITKTREWDIISQHKEKFLTTKCRHTFGGYAYEQIKKAKGLDKKMNWESSRIERKQVEDFCYVGHLGKSFPLKTYLKDNELNSKYVGLVKLDHMADSYAIYYDNVAEYAETKYVTIPRGEQFQKLGFKGISSDNGNSLLLSNVPKYVQPEPGTLYFNKSEYSKHCAEYKSYQTWLKERNEQRYVDSQAHGQKIDGKNLLHCIRLIQTALDIAKYGELKVRRENADELIKIRKGEVNLEDVLNKAESQIEEMKLAFDNSSLPHGVENKLVNNILLEIRESQIRTYSFYTSNNGEFYD